MRHSWLIVLAICVGSASAERVGAQGSEPADIAELTREIRILRAELALAREEIKQLKAEVAGLRKSVASVEAAHAIEDSDETALSNEDPESHGDNLTIQTLVQQISENEKEVEAAETSLLRADIRQRQEAEVDREYGRRRLSATWPITDIKKTGERYTLSLGAPKEIPGRLRYQSEVTIELPEATARGITAMSVITISGKPKVVRTDTGIAIANDTILLREFAESAVRAPDSKATQILVARINTSQTAMHSIYLQDVKFQISIAGDLQSP